MAQIGSLPYAIHQVFSDFDDLSEAARQWTLDLRQLDRGAFHGELTQFGVGAAHVSRARFGRKLIQKGSPLNGRRMIAVPSRNVEEFFWRGIRVTNQDLIVFPRGAEMAATSNPDFDVYTCSFSEELLRTLSESQGVGELDEMLGDASVIRCRVSALESARKCFGQLCSQIRGGASLGDPQLVHCLSHDLPIRLLSAISTSHGARVSETTRKRELALVRAEAFIERSAQENIDVRDMSRVAQVSKRTLEYAFVERFGLAPSAYLKSHRLNSVRRELRAADPEAEKVADIANRWGFWHLGQFAADYRAQFDELPSQTLRRANS